MYELDLIFDPLIKEILCIYGFTFLGEKCVIHLNQSFTVFKFL